MTPDNHTPKSTVATSILARIAGEHITPTPRYAFLLLKSFLITLVLLTILMGTLAVAVMIFVMLSANYALYEATHRNFTTFFFDALPALWALSFIALTALLYTQLRFFKHGYRYSAAKIIGGSLLLSCVGGLVLHGIGFGFALDQFLGKQVTMYRSVGKMEFSMWQMPAAGRLVGALTDSAAEREAQFGDNVPLFLDAAGVEWRLETSELDEDEIELLADQKLVRLLGTSTAPGIFHACGVFLWMFTDDWGRGRSDLEKERTRFEAKMKSSQERLEAGEAMMVPPPDNDMICAHLETLRRRR